MTFGNQYTSCRKAHVKFCCHLHNMILYSIVRSPENKKRGTFDWRQQSPISRKMSWLKKSQALKLSVSKLEAQEMFLVQEINTKMSHIEAVKALMEKDA